MLGSRESVIMALVRYTDWWQPSTTSVMQVPRRGASNGDGIRPGLLETLDLRTELCRRMQLVSDRDRELLYLWYLEQLPVGDIAKALRISRRQCFRRRAAAIRTIVDAGEERDPAVA